MRIKIRPVRWWRDDETRFMPRPEFRAFVDARRFNLSEVPRGDNPELDALVEDCRDKGNLVDPRWSYGESPILSAYRSMRDFENLWRGAVGMYGDKI